MKVLKDDRGNKANMNIIIFGMGSVGKKHYSLMREMYPYYNYFAFKRSFQKQSDKDLKHIYSWDELDSIGFDLALICSPTNNHIEHALECAKRGVNLFIEKPLSDRMEKLNELSDLTTKYNLVTLIGYNLRFHPVIVKAKQFVENSADKVISFSSYCGSYLPDWRRGDYRSYYSGKKEQGGGVVFDLSHEIDYCKWLFGKPVQVISAYGKHSMLDIDAEDIAEIIFKYDDKIGSIHLDYCRIIPKREIEIITDRSIFKGDLISGTWLIAGNDLEDKGSYEVSNMETYRKQLEHLINLLNVNIDPICDLEDAIETMNLLMEVKGEAY